jgi:muramoyltetrapeptide carboxypeptidase
MTAARAIDDMVLVLLSPAGVVTRPQALTRASRRLAKLGFDVRIDGSARARFRRFAGSDDVRLEALHRVAREAPSIAMSTRGGYGLTRLLDRIDWKLLAKSIERGTRWVGHSDLTALQMGLLARGHHVTWGGPLACDHFGRADEEGGVDELTQACFVEAMDGSLQAVGWRCGPGFDGLEGQGTLWGGNLSVLLSLLGTPYWPDVRGGVLFIEDVNEHPYRIERGLLQLLQAGVIDRQKALVLGQFTAYKPAAHDRGFSLRTVVDDLRKRTRTPVLTGLPFGHVPTIVMLPVGAKVSVAVQGREAYLGWEHEHG